MTISALRQFWSLIEAMQISTLLRLSDAELAQQLLVRLERETWLDVDDISSIRAYLHSKLPLIRDLAQAPLSEASS
ncbi:MAG: hypothetical protein F6K14_08565 [Symploca sp. SIO2C1]|nr:hypothetical protein [Symploca sp. SIO2C1]